MGGGSVLPETSHRFPQVLLGGQAVLFTIHAPSGRDDDARVAVLSVGSGARKVLVEGGSYGRYVPTGHLLYANGGTVFAAPFDVSRLDLTGPAVAVLDDVRMGANSTGAAQLDFSSSGTLVYVTPHARPREAALLWADRKGSVVPLSGPRRPFSNVNLSPDGRRLIATVDSSTGSDLWLHDIAAQTWTRLTFDKDNWQPRWSPDGDRIVFASNREGARNLFLMPSAGGPAERLTTSVQWQYPSDWSADGRVIFNQLEREKAWDIWDVALDGHRRPRPIVSTKFSESDATLSPDGRWIVFQSTESGRSEIYVAPYPGLNRKWLVSRDGGDNAAWRRTGNELFFQNGNRLMAVSVRTHPTFQADPPVILFDRPFINYDPAPDGKRFVLVEDAEPEPERLQVVVVPDWFEELKAKVPVPQR
jgi:serine/threonine-protein kinase